MGCICKNNKVTINIKPKRSSLDEYQIKLMPITFVTTFYFDKIQPSSILAIFHFFVYKEIKEMGKINRQFNLISRNPHLFKKFFINSHPKCNDQDNAITVNDPCINDHLMTTHKLTSSNRESTSIESNIINTEKGKKIKVIFPSFADYKMLSSGTNNTDQSYAIKRTDESFGNKSNINIKDSANTKSIFDYNSKTSPTLSISIQSNSSWSKKCKEEIGQHNRNRNIQTISIMEIYSSCVEREDEGM